MVQATSVAVIDIGSNSIKSLVAARRADGTLEAQHARTLDARISDGLGQSEPRLGEEGMARGLAAIHTLLTETAGFAPAHTVLVATSAVRDAANGADFCRRIRATTGHTVRLLSGEEEAALIGRGLICDPALATLGNFYVFDLGGGSLECLSFRDRILGQAVSLPLGCVRMTEKFFRDPAAPLVAAECTALARHVRDALKSSGFRFRLHRTEAVFTGGSMTTVRALTGAQHGVKFEDTPAHVLTDTLRFLLDELAPLPLDARKAVPGMPAARADVFPAALVTMLALAEHGELAGFHHSLHNLRWGLAAEALA